MLTGKSVLTAIVVTASLSMPFAAQALAVGNADVLSCIDAETMVFTGKSSSKGSIHGSAEPNDFSGSGKGGSVHASTAPND